MSTLENALFRFFFFFRFFAFSIMDEGVQVGVNQVRLSTFLARPHRHPTFAQNTHTHTSRLTRHIDRHVPPPPPQRRPKRAAVSAKCEVASLLATKPTTQKKKNLSTLLSRNTNTNQINQTKHQPTQQPTNTAVSAGCRSL